MTHPKQPGPIVIGNPNDRKLTTPELLTANDWAELAKMIQADIEASKTKKEEDK